MLDRHQIASASQTLHDHWRAGTKLDALDSWLRSQFYKNHNKEKACPDKKIERHYNKFGKWRGLAIWCDMTEKWIA